VSTIKLAVIMGGPSTEHEISLKSGQAVLDNLDPKKYNVLKVVIDKNEKWLFGHDPKTHNRDSALRRLKIESGLVVFIALHGTFGEDGTIQRILETNQIAFTGSSSEASKLAMDKEKCNKIYQNSGLQIPVSTVIANASDHALTSLMHAHNFPVFVKPVSQGSSVGVHFVKIPDELKAAIRDAFRFDNQVMIQKYIKGREFSCGVLEETQSGEAYALPPTELIPLRSEFFDYDAKYSDGGADEITPPDLPQRIIAEIQSMSVVAHRALGCSGYSRSDMILDKSNKPYMIETNTLPGLTPASILPKQVEAAGMSFGNLLDQLIRIAIEHSLV